MEFSNTFLCGGIINNVFIGSIFLFVYVHLVARPQTGRDVAEQGSV